MINFEKPINIISTINLTLTTFCTGIPLGKAGKASEAVKVFTAIDSNIDEWTAALKLQLNAEALKYHADLTRRTLLLIERINRLFLTLVDHDDIKARLSKKDAINTLYDMLKRATNDIKANGEEAQATKLE